jgi:hypothetical protein
MNTEPSYNSIIERIYFFASTTLVPIGLLLNILQIIVFGSKSFKKLNIGFMMITYTIFDSIALFWNFVVYGYLESLYSFETFSAITCSLFQYISRVIQQLPFYYQAFISFTSFLSVNYPVKYTQFNKISNHIYSIIIILISIFFLNIPTAIKYIEINKSNSSITSSCRPINYLVNQIATIETAIIRCLIPIFLIVSFNIFSVKKLIESRRNLNANLKKEIRFCILLIILNIVFLLFNFPFFYFSILKIFYNNSNYSSFIVNCTGVFAWIYYGIGFFINTFSNKLFRKNLIKIIKFEKINL